MYKSVQENIPLIIDRPHGATRNTAARVNTRVNGFLKMTTGAGDKPFGDRHQWTCCRTNFPSP